MNPPKKGKKESGMVPMALKFFYALNLSLGCRTTKGGMKFTCLHRNSAQKSKKAHESHRKLALKLLFQKNAEGPHFSVEYPHLCERSALLCGRSAL